MKVTNRHLREMTAAIKPLDTSERRARYLAGDFPRADQVQDLNKRYRWDLFYLAKQSVPNAWTDFYLMSHLDTALRRIVPPL